MEQKSKYVLIFYFFNSSMSFRRDGKTAHDESAAWNAWLETNADLIPHCGLPPGVFRSRRDWLCLLDKGYWCEHYYGSHIGNIDFDLNSLSSTESEVLRQLLERTLRDDEKQHGCAAWHHVHPPGGY